MSYPFSSLLLSSSSTSVEVSPSGLALHDSSPDSLQSVSTFPVEAHVESSVLANPSLASSSQVEEPSTGPGAAGDLDLSEPASTPTRRIVRFCDWLDDLSLTLSDVYPDGIPSSAVPGDADPVELGATPSATKNGLSVNLDTPGVDVPDDSRFPNTSVYAPGGADTSEVNLQSPAPEIEPQPALGATTMDDDAVSRGLAPTPFHLKAKMTSRVVILDRFHKVQRSMMHGVVLPDGSERLDPCTSTSVESSCTGCRASSPLHHVQHLTLQQHVTDAIRLNHSQDHPHLPPLSPFTRVWHVTKAANPARPDIDLHARWTELFDEIAAMYGDIRGAVIHIDRFGKGEDESGQPRWDGEMMSEAELLSTYGASASVLDYSNVLDIRVPDVQGLPAVLSTYDPANRKVRAALADMVDETAPVKFVMKSANTYVVPALPTRKPKGPGQRNRWDDRTRASMALLATMELEGVVPVRRIGSSGKLRNLDGSIPAYDWSEIPY